MPGLLLPSAGSRVVRAARALVPKGGSLTTQTSGLSWGQGHLGGEGLLWLLHPRFLGLVGSGGAVVADIEVPVTPNAS